MWRRASRRAKPKKNNKKFFNVFLGTLIACALIAYIIQVNGIATKGYKMKELEQRIEELSKAKRELEGKSLELQSLSAIGTRLEELQMVQAQDAIYLYPNAKTVLKK